MGAATPLSPPLAKNACAVSTSHPSLQCPHIARERLSEAATYRVRVKEKNSLFERSEFRVFRPGTRIRGFAAKRLSEQAMRGLFTLPRPIKQQHAEIHQIHPSVAVEVRRRVTRVPIEKKN